MIWPLVYLAVVTLSGGTLIGFFLGLRYAAARAALHPPVPPHEALARVYQLPAPAGILAELRGPLEGHASSGQAVRDLAPPSVGPAPGARA